MSLECKWKPYGINKLSSYKYNGKNTRSSLYYYTSVDTMQKILESGCIFATNILSLNDFREFFTGTENIFASVEDSIEKQKEELRRDNGSSDSDCKELKYILEDLKEWRKVQIETIEESYQLEFLKKATKAYGIVRYVKEGEVYRYRYGEGGAFDCDRVFPEVYSISFTAESDLLSQWKMYAQESGVAIEFDFNRQVVWSQELENGERGFEISDVLPRKVEYPEDERQELLNNCDVWENKDMFFEAPFYKDKGFSHENEYRLVFYPAKNEKKGADYCTAVNYRISNHKLIPHLKIYCRSKKNVLDEGWPVASITVGPGGNQDLVYRGVVHYIEYKRYKVSGITEDSVRQSAIRYYRDLLEYLCRENRIDIDKYVIRYDAEVEDYVIKGEFPKELQEAENYLYKIILNIVSEELHLIEDCSKYFERYVKNNYLASNGIIVKKSRIPYIYS